MSEKQNKNLLKKKRGADGKELAEQIGKGINPVNVEKALEGRQNSEMIVFRLPAQQKEAFMEGNKNPSELLRAFVRGVNSQKNPIQ